MIEKIRYFPWSAAADCGLQTLILQLYPFVYDGLKELVCSVLQNLWSAIVSILGSPNILNQMPVSKDKKFVQNLKGNRIQFMPGPGHTNPKNPERSSEHEEEPCGVIRASLKRRLQNLKMKNMNERIKSKTLVNEDHVASNEVDDIRLENNRKREITKHLRQDQIQVQNFQHIVKAEIENKYRGDNLIIEAGNRYHDKSVSDITYINDYAAFVNKLRNIKDKKQNIDQKFKNEVDCVSGEDHSPMINSEEKLIDVDSLCSNSFTKEIPLLDIGDKYVLSEFSFEETLEIIRLESAEVNSVVCRVPHLRRDSLFGSTEYILEKNTRDTAVQTDSYDCLAHEVLIHSGQLLQKEIGDVSVQTDTCDNLIPYGSMRYNYSTRLCDIPQYREQFSTTNAPWNNFVCQTLVPINCATLRGGFLLVYFP